MRRLFILVACALLLSTASCGGSFCWGGPTIVAVSPARVVAGSPDLTLTISGRNFQNASSVWWNDARISNARIVSDTEIVIIVPASFITVSGPAAVKVLPAQNTIVCSADAGVFFFEIS